MVLPFVSAWAGHTPDSHGAAASLARAIRACYPKQANAADGLGIGAADLSRQLAGRDGLNLWRLASSRDLYAQFLRFEAERLGALFVSDAERRFILACVQVGKKTMARALPQLSHPERKNA